MAQPRDATISKIRQYATSAREQYQAHMEMDADALSTGTRLEQTIQELQEQIEHQRAALERLRTTYTPNINTAAVASADPRERLQQLRTVKRAYASLKPAVPFLPAHGSMLPVLLTARALQQNIKGTKEAIASTEERLTKSEDRLRFEDANLKDAKVLASTMEARIDRLQTQHEERTQKSSAQLAKELIAVKRDQKRSYGERAKQLADDFHIFIAEVLSPMLAAEELGGPVVGEMPDVEDDTLAIGFTAKGRAKSTKKPPSEDTRQKRIDKIWGNAAATDGDDQPTEAEAAGNEMQELIENLFATVVGPGGGKAYYELQRDSAASRFLVRAKIAQFHPKDARKLRLIDFGRELDD